MVAAGIFPVLTEQNKTTALSNFVLQTQLMINNNHLSLVHIQTNATKKSPPGITFLQMGNTSKPQCNLCTFPHGHGVSAMCKGG